MEIRRLRQVFLVARDLQSQIDFYQNALGLRLQFRDGDRWAQFQAGEVSFALASPEEGQGAAAGVAVPVFEVADLEVARQDLAATGARTGEIRDMGSHGRTLPVTDPGGGRLVLFEKRR